jgi:hypothetical protein
MQSRCTPGAVPPSGIHRFSSFPVRFHITGLRDGAHGTPEGIEVPPRVALGGGQCADIASGVRTTHHLPPE